MDLNHLVLSIVYRDVRQVEEHTPFLLVFETDLRGSYADYILLSEEMACVTLILGSMCFMCLLESYLDVLRSCWMLAFNTRSTSELLLDKLSQLFLCTVILFCDEIDGARYHRHIQALDD